MGHIQNLLKVQHKGHDSKSPPPPPLWKCLACELLGTFLLIFIGCGVGLQFKNDTEGKALVQVALCWGFLIASLAQSLHYSCDLNPAVTLAKTVTGHISLVHTVAYIITQIVGCLAGAYVLKLLTPEDIIGDYGATKLAADVLPGKGVVIEAISTGFLVFTIFSAGDPKRTDLKGSIPLSVGLCICGLIISAAPYTSASFNPARTLGPSIVANNFDDHWVYWVGPISGGIIGGLLYEHVFRIRGDNDDDEPLPSPV